MNTWTPIHTEKHGRLDIHASWDWDTTPISHSFDESCYDVEEYERKVNNGDLYWFVLRVQVFLNGAEIGSDYLGGCLYENVEDVLNDDCYDDVKYRALEEAEKWLTTVFKERKLIEYTVNKLTEGA